MRCLAAALACAFLVVPARAMEPVIDFAQIARVTQQLATSLKQLQLLAQSKGDLGELLRSAGPLAEMADLDTTMLGGLGRGGSEIGRLVERAFPDGLGLGTLGSINLDEVGRWAIKQGVEGGLGTRGIAGKAFDLAASELARSIAEPGGAADAERVARSLARGGYAGFETVPGVTDAILRGARGEMQSLVDRAFGVGDGLLRAGIDLGLPQASSLRQALDAGVDRAAIARLAYGAILDGAQASGTSLDRIDATTIAGWLGQAGLRGLETIPGLADAVRESAQTLGGIADLAALAPPAQLFQGQGGGRASDATSFATIAATRDTVRAALWRTGQAATDAQGAVAERRRAESEAIALAYPVALRLRAELAKQPQRLERLAADAAAAATMNQQLREANKATLALVQSTSRIEAALAALLALESTAALQTQPTEAGAALPADDARQRSNDRNAAAQ